MNISPLGIFGGPIPSSALPPAANVGAGTLAYTSDLGELVSDGVSAWLPALTRGKILTTVSAKNRVALIGDSIAQKNGALLNLPTTAGSFVVSGGIGTLTFGANVGVLTGNYFTLQNVSDAGLTHPDNGRAFLCIAGSNPVTFTTVATFASNAANGDYSNYAGGTWSVNWHTSNFDTGLFTVLNAYARQQFLVTLNYGAVGELSANTLAKIPRILAGPPFEIAYLCCDAINDALTTNGAVASAVIAANNYISCIKQLQIGGKQVWIQTPNPIHGTAGGGSRASALFLMIVRKNILEYCKANSLVVVLDPFKEMIAGQFTGTTDGYVATNSVGTFVVASDVHPNQNGYYTTARNQPYLAAGQVGYPQIENSLLSLLDDSVAFTQTGNPYLNLQNHGGMDGTSGTVAGTNGSGTAATGWTLTATGTPTSCVGTGGFTPTQVGTTNSQNFGFAQRIQLTASGANQGFDFKGPFNPPITPGWYQIGFKVYSEGIVGGGSPTNGLGSIYLNYNFSPGNCFAQGIGSFDIGYQLLVGDQLWIATGPIYFDRAPGIGQLHAVGISAGAGSFALQISEAFQRPIDNPYV